MVIIAIVADLINCRGRVVMEETVYTITPISGVEITRNEDTGLSTVMVGAQNMEAAEDMFYAFASTCKTSLHMPRHKILELCLRAMIFND
jgi:hypothetical protein